MACLAEWMGSIPNPPIKRSIFIGTMLNFDGDRHGDGDGTCKQALRCGLNDHCKSLQYTSVITFTYFAISRRFCFSLSVTVSGGTGGFVGGDRTGGTDCGDVAPSDCTVSLVASPGTSGAGTRASLCARATASPLGFCGALVDPLGEKYLITERLISITVMSIVQNYKSICSFTDKSHSDPFLDIIV